MGNYVKKSLIILFAIILVSSILSSYTTVEANNRILIARLETKELIPSDSDVQSSSGVTSGKYSDQMKSLITQADKTEGEWSSAEAKEVENSANKIMSTIITIVRIIGVTVALVMLLVLAMKYMSAAPGEKADIKKSAVVYVVGAVVLFAVTGILGIINQFAGTIK